MSKISKREKLRRIKKEQAVTKIERNIYFFSSVLFILTVIMNIHNIIYYPQLLNGLILEVNVLVAIITICTFVKKQKKYNDLEEKKLELKIKYIMRDQVSY